MDARQAHVGQRSFTIGSVVTRSVIFAACMIFGSATALRSQETGAAGGQPPDLMTTMGFATHVPEAKDFVRRARPAPESLEFRSPYAMDDVRPRPRSTADVEALTRDLESAGARNRARASKGARAPSAAPSRPSGPR